MITTPGGLERHVDIGGVQLWADRRGAGNGETVLLLTGATLQCTAWEPSFTDVLLRAGYDLIRFDWRDTGLSTWRSYKEHPYSADTLVDDAAAVLDAFDIRGAHVVGFSMGGIMAQLLALRHPARVRSLSLLAAAFASAEGANIGRGERSRALFDVLGQPRPETENAGVERLVDQWRELCGRSWPFDETEWRSRAAAWIARGHNWSCPHLRLWTGVTAVSRRRELAGIACPVLVLHGDDEAMFPVAHGQAIAAAITHADFFVLAGRGHDIHLDPDIAELVVSHLGSDRP